MRRPKFCNDGFLRGFHCDAFVGLAVLVAGKMKEAVDEVAENLTSKGLVVFSCLSLGDLGADDNLTVVEGDHVGGTFDVHEIAVDLVAGGIIDNRNLEGREIG